VAASVLLPLGVAAGLFLSSQWDRQQANALVRLQAQAQALQVAVDRELALDQAVLQTLAASPDIDTGQWARFHAAAVRAAAVRPGSVVTLFAPDGANLVNSSLPYGTPLPNVRQRPPETEVIWRDRRVPLPDLALFIEPFETGQPKVSGLVWGRLSRRPVVATHVPVVRQGSVAYVIGLSYGVDAYAALLASIGEVPGLTRGLVDAGGLVVARTPGHETMVGRRAPSPFDQGRGLLPERGTGESRNLEGALSYYAYARIPASGWTVAVGQPRELVLAPALRTLWWSLAVLVAAAAIGTVVALRLARRIAVPLLDLAARAGDADSELPPVQGAGIDEVDRLAKALQAAAENQRARRQVERDREQAREELRRANERLTEADRQKDDFLGMLSHELRNPLGPIRNALHILDRTEPGDPRGVEARHTIHRQVLHMASLVDDLLDVTRIARGKLELRLGDCDLVALARGVAQDYAGLFSARGIAFSAQFAEPQLPVRCDMTRIAQVIGNLLHNAAKFTPPGGTVSMTVRADADHAVVEVADSGAGIGPGLLPTVFQPFVQAEQGLARSEGGLGLGLALVRGIVDLHGGAVLAASRGAGHGSRFTVRLPRERQALPDAPAAPQASLPRERGVPRRVLLVEDNEDAAQSMAELIRLFGHAVEVARDGVRALERLRTQRPDTVFCDIGLPGMSGYELAARLRAEGPPGLCLVALTGYAAPDDVRRALAAGFDVHLAKPVDPQRIAALLGDASAPSSLHSIA
jgi:signal transduction histidine kinase/ActR/RegA family two-component response regulator